MFPPIGYSWKSHYNNQSDLKRKQRQNSKLSISEKDIRRDKDESKIKWKGISKEIIQLRKQMKDVQEWIIADMCKIKIQRDKIKLFSQKLINSKQANKQIEILRVQSQKLTQNYNLKMSKYRLMSDQQKGQQAGRVKYNFLMGDIKYRMNQQERLLVNQDCLEKEIQYEKSLLTVYEEEYKKNISFSKNLIQLYERLLYKMKIEEK